MKAVFTIILFCCITSVSDGQAWVWQQSITTFNNGVATDPNENVIVFGIGGPNTYWKLSKFTKDGTLIWSREFTKPGTYNTAIKGSVVADHSGNIYIYDEGFDSINHVFTGHVPSGITKLSPNGAMLWHKEYSNWYIASGNTVYNIVVKADLQIDDADNIYCIFTCNKPATLGTVTLGTTSVPVPPPGSAMVGSLAVGSLQPDGTTRWLRAFAQGQFSNATVWEVAGAAVFGNKLHIAGHQNNGNIYLDNGLTITTGRSSEWLATLNTANGQSIWGVSHGLFYSCNGMICEDARPGFTVNAVTGQPAIIGNLKGAFVFKPADTVSSQKITPFLADTARNYYAVYDSIGTPIKAKVYRPWAWALGSNPISSNFNNCIAPARNGDYFLFYNDTLVRVDTGFNIKSMVKANLVPASLYISKYTNDIYATGSGYVRKMVDSSGVISGKTYADWNNNGAFDAGDSALSGILLTTNNNVVNAVSSPDSGRYSIYAIPGSYTVSANFNHPYYQFSPASHSATINSYGDTIQGKDFRLRPISNFVDVNVKLTSNNRVRRFWYSTYTTIVKNYSPTPQSVTVGLRLPANTSYNNFYGGGNITVNAPDSITIDAGTLNPFETKHLVFSLLISGNANIGDTLKFYPIAYPYSNDVIQANNRDTLVQVVSGSFDPNEKANNVSKQSLADTGKAITYTINFQNTGNDTAFYVRVADTLSSKLDIQTFNFIDASHPVTASIKGNIINFIFNPIALVDSIHNEPLSHGFAKFSIRPKAPFTIGDTIYNNASIYFDFNTPVITNTTKNWFFDVALPVLLKSFVAEKQSTSVLLKFVTASEPGLKNFIIERSADGVNFSAIGSVASKGDANTGSIYSFNDPSPKPGINFYRLKMIDKDGRFTYSWIVIVQFDKNQDAVKVSPNPANDNLYINFSSNSAETYSCRLLDAEGKTIWTADVNTSIRNTFFINTSSLAEGIYFVSVKNEKADYRQKVVVKH